MFHFMQLHALKIRQTLFNLGLVVISGLLVHILEHTSLPARLELALAHHLPFHSRLSGPDNKPASKYLTKGGRIVFFGDSFPEFGDEWGGYVWLIRQELNRRYPELELEVIHSGVRGDTASDLRQRVDRDLPPLKPTVVVINTGINEAFLGIETQNSNLEGYRRDLYRVIKQLKKGGIKVILCSPTVIGEKIDGPSPFDGMLDEYVAIDQYMQSTLHTPVVNLRHAFLDYLKEHNKDNQESGLLTGKDGVHPNAEGAKVIAHEIMRILAPE